MSLVFDLITVCEHAVTKLCYACRRDASELERKTLAQLEEVRSKLLAKETEISILQADINMLTVDRDNKVVEMEGKLP